MCTEGLDSRLFLSLKIFETACLGSYFAVGTPFQYMMSLSKSVDWLVEVLPLLKSILKVEKHLSTVMLSGETTTMADKNSCTSPVLFLK